MTFSRTFYRSMAVISALAGIGPWIVVLLDGSVPPADGFDAEMALYLNQAFVAQMWVILVQVFFMFLALWAVATRSLRAATGPAATGFLLVLIWQVFELIPRAVEVVAVQRVWVPAYLNAVAAEKAELVQLIQASFLVEDAIVMVRQLLFAVGLLLLGGASWRGSRLQRVVALLLLANGVRVAFRVLGAELGIGWMAALVAPLFPILMPALFLAVAAWLWLQPAPEPAR